jgi:hypothetical protein
MLAGKLAEQKMERSTGASRTSPNRISVHGRLGTWLSRLVSSLATALTRRYERFRWSHPRLCELASALGSFYRRILRLSSKDYSFGCEMGPALEMTALGFLRLNTKTHARIDCIQKLRASQPWLSPSDWRLILLGWEQGYRFCDANRRDRGIPQLDTALHSVRR